METNEITPQEEKQKKNRLFLYLFLLMTGVCVVLGWLLMNQKAQTDTVVTENIQITAESEVVKRDLQQLQTEYAMLETNDVFLKAEIQEKKALIEQLQRDAEKHKDDAYIMARLKKETKTLRDIMQHFVVEIDSLNTVNKKLVAQNDTLHNELSTEKQKRNTLQSEKDKLYEIGSVIKATGMTVVALNVKSKTKATETSKAKRADKIQINFKLGENPIAQKGPRNIYIRIVMPDGKEWCDSPDADHLFTFGSSKGYYAMKKTIQYNNEDINVEMLVRKKENQELPSGKYHIEVCLDNSPVGKATLELD
jgi:cell division protein FtsB